MKATFNVIARSLGRLFLPAGCGSSRAFDRRLASVKRDSRARCAILDAVWQCSLDTGSGVRLDRTALRRAIKQVRSALPEMSGTFRPEQATFLCDAVETMRDNAFSSGAGANCIDQLDRLGHLLTRRCPPTCIAADSDPQPPGATWGGPARRPRHGRP
ncbi:hypothetical protein SAMN05216551_102143 [Chitinasiproducens palmae]|uniref:Uncharacterized protein n=2 Tax=Chitinasiproducens palmae TaxID=1770053 RepID=A0A1H2PKL5_9BURK|nr:hypothetical protein SAMN05216551_102143 [Chitinasiproducens palmae]